MNKRYYIIIIAAIAMLLSSCHGEEKSGDVVILYTTDVHGNVVQYDFSKQKPASYSLANASTYIKELRNQYGKDMLLFDCGDLYEGTPAMYFHNYYPQEQHLASRVVNYLKYDALVVGNHDLESGEEMFNDVIGSQLNMPRLSANSVDTRNGRTMFRPYKIFERHGFRIAVLGLVTAETGDQVPHNLVPHVEFRSMVTYAKRWVNEIINNESPDYIIGILHAGIKDYEFTDERNAVIKEGIQQIADSVRGFDLILFGHDHNVYEGEVVNIWGDTVRIFQPAPHSEELGRIDLHFQRNKDKSVSKSTSVERIKLADIAIDEQFAKDFSGAIDTVNNFLNTPVGYLNEDFDNKHTLFKQTNAMDFIHMIQLQSTGADISFSSALSTFKDLNSGPLTLRDLFSIYKYDNKVQKMWMTGEEVKKFLEYGYSRQFGVMKSPEDHLLAFKYDEKGNLIYGRWGPDLVVPQYNYTSAGGLNYEVDVRRPAGDRVIIKTLADGTPFDLAQNYTVALSSFQAAGGGGFITRGLGWSDNDIAYHTLSESARTIIYLIYQYLQREGQVSTTPQGHWKAIPEQWTNPAGERDAALLLPYIVK